MTFLWTKCIFHFEIHRKISMKIFHKYGMPWGYVKLCTKSEIKKIWYLGRYGLLSKMTRLESAYFSYKCQFNDHMFNIYFIYLVSRSIQ